MSTLYELENEYMQLLLMAEDEELDPECLKDTIEAIEGEIEVKADGYAKVIRQLEADMAAVQAEKDRLAGRQKTIENNIKRLKESLQGAMELTGKEKFKTNLFSFGIQNNPASVVMDEPYIENVPEEYLTYPEPTINRKKIAEDIKNGINLEGLAHLEQTRGLRIR